MKMNKVVLCIIFTGIFIQSAASVMPQVSREEKIEKYSKLVCAAFIIGWCALVVHDLKNTR